MIVESEKQQINLNDSGELFWQEDKTNPLPGVLIAKLEKGPSLLSPEIKVIDDRGEDSQKISEYLQKWLLAHITETFEPLMEFEAKKDISQPCQEIFQKLFQNIGIIPREWVEDIAQALSAEERKVVREHKIKLGPILIFMPGLNKPAAVRLKALLLSLWNEKELPAQIPADGIVSFSYEGAQEEKSFYQSIGFPVFGGRACRIDMLDRVVCEIYDTAEKGRFQAQHKMAEWLGCSIEGLYDVLCAMGHVKESVSQERKTKEDNKAENKVGNKQDKNKEEENKEEENKEEENKKDTKEDNKSEAHPKEAGLETVLEEISKDNNENKKPELSWFRLKKGKAYTGKKQKQSEYKGRKKASGVSQEAKHADNKNSNKKNVYKSKKAKSKKPDNRQARVYTAENKNREESPFAVLEQLKKTTNS